MFALLIITRILFIACIVFIIDYVFGGFSKRKALRRITRIAAILLIILFISMNFFIRGSSRYSFGCPWGHHNESYWHSDDSSKLYHYQYRHPSDTLYPRRPVH